MKILLCIDVQNGFVNDNSKDIVKPIINATRSSKFNYIIATQFINTKSSVYYTKLNWKRLIQEPEINLVDGLNYDVSYKKKSYSSYTDKFKEIVSTKNITKNDEIYICGIDTDCCVLFTVIDLFQKGYNIYVVEDICASTGGKEIHENALNILRRNIGRNRVLKYENIRD